MNRLKALIITLAISFIFSGPVSAQSYFGDDASSTEVVRAITEKIEELTDNGMPLAEAIEAVIKRLALAVNPQQNNDLVKDIYAAVAMAVKNTGQDRNSQSFAAAIEVTSAILIQTYGVSEDILFAMAITENIEELTDIGVPLAEAIETVIERLANADNIQRNNDLIKNIYAAVATAVENTGEDRNSQSFAAAIAVVSAILIQTYGISEDIVVASADAAGVNIDTIINTLPATAAGPESSPTIAINATQKNTASGGGGAASPAT